MNSMDFTENFRGKRLNKRINPTQLTKSFVPQTYKKSKKTAISQNCCLFSTEMLQFLLLVCLLQGIINVANAEGNSFHEKFHMLH